LEELFQVEVTENGASPDKVMHGHWLKRYEFHNNRWANCWILDNYLDELEYVINHPVTFKDKYRAVEEVILTIDEKKLLAEASNRLEDIYEIEFRSNPSSKSFWDIVEKIVRKVSVEELEDDFT
jgi:hypothetical protein